jgi:hypothetical protein
MEPSNYPRITPDGRPQIFNLFLSLIEICDSFDQLGKLAAIIDQIYCPTCYEHQPLFYQMEMTARHLRGLPAIGATEVK